MASNRLIYTMSKLLQNTRRPSFPQGAEGNGAIGAVCDIMRKLLPGASPPSSTFTFSTTCIQAVLRV